MESTLIPEFRDVFPLPLLLTSVALPRCAVSVCHKPCKENMTSRVPGVEAFSFLMEKIGEDLNLPV